MKVIKIVYWEDDGAWLGYLQDYPDDWTQGETFEDLMDHLKDLYHDLVSGSIPAVRKVALVHQGHSLNNKVAVFLLLSRLI